MPPQVSKTPPPAGESIPAALGAYLLARLTALETHAARLTQKAEAAGDTRAALTTLRLNFKILLAMAKLARQVPEAAQTWQAPVASPPQAASDLSVQIEAADSHSPAAAPEPTASTTPLTGGHPTPPLAGGPGGAPPSTPPPATPRDTRLRPVNANW